MLFLRIKFITADPIKLKSTKRNIFKHARFSLSKVLSVSKKLNKATYYQQENTDKLLKYILK